MNRITSSSLRIASEVQLNAAEDNMFGSDGCRPGGGTAVAKRRGFIIQLEFDVAVQVPVDAGAPGGLLLGGDGAGKKREESAVHGHLPKARNQFHRPPTAVMDAHRILRHDRVKRIVF